MTIFSTYLKTAGRTQKEFAGTIGVSTAYLSELVAGIKSPSLAIAIAIERETRGAVSAASWVDAKQRQDSEVGPC